MSGRILTTYCGLVSILWLVSASARANAQTTQDGSAFKAQSTTYRLGPGDKIVVWALGAEELSDKPLIVGDDGYVDLPMLGRLRASGLTPDQLRGNLSSALLPYVRSPRVSVSVTEVRSQPVSIMGEVNRPGVYQVHGGETLSEVLSQAEGTRPDAGSTIRISRRPEEIGLELPNAAPQPDGGSVAEVRTKDLMDGKLESLLVAPHDVIRVSKSPIVYVIGEVHKPGGFAVGERDSLSALQALSMAEGLVKTATPQKARILRLNPDSATRTDIPVDLRRILAGKKPDVRMQPDDILFVPDSKIKGGIARIAEIAVGAMTGAIIYRAY
jgi:polysaccharide biosynthesis/export protein